MKKAWLYGALLLCAGIASAQVTQKAPDPAPKKPGSAKSAPSPLWKSGVSPKTIVFGECDVTGPGQNCKVQVTVAAKCQIKASPDIVKIRGKLSSPSKVLWQVGGGWEFDEKLGIEFKTADGKKVFPNCARSATNKDEFSCDNTHTAGLYDYNIRVTKDGETCYYDPGAWNTPVP